jgi:hypothetical protein
VTLSVLNSTFGSGSIDQNKRDGQKKKKQANSKEDYQKDEERK